MALRDQPSGWGRLSQALHWLTVLLVAEQIVLSRLWRGAPGPEMDRLIDTHRAVGIAILVLTALRLLWHAATPGPAPARLPLWQRRASRAVHAALYVLLLAAPVAGWAHSSAAGYDVRILGVTLPPLLPKDKTTSDTTGALHALLAKSLVILAGLHAVAGLRHGLLGDGGARRML